MPTINDLPDDPIYTIKSVAAQTGILPVTLRAWERRHEVLSPHRGDNRYRLYSERDVAILRWLKSRVDEGTAISGAVNELRRLEKSGTWPEVVIAPPPQLSRAASIAPPEPYARHLFQALIKHNESRASELLSEAHAQFNLMIIFNHILVPTLRLIGEAWYRGEIRVTTEHFASAFLRGRLLALLQAYPIRRGAPSVLVGCAPMEQHELGSLMLAVLMRSEGLRVEYLGPDIPIEDLAEYARYELPALIVLSASSEYSARELRPLHGLLQEINPPPIFAFGGMAFDLNEKLRREVPGIYLGNTLEAAMESIRVQLKSRPKAAAVRG